MDWSIAGVVAEVVGAIAVVITLVFLTVEIRQNRIAVEAATQASISEGWNSVNAVILGSSEVGEIRAKGFDDPESLNQSEKVRFVILGQSCINQFTLEKRLADSGALMKEPWEEHAAALSHIMNSAGGKYIVENMAVSPDIIDTIKTYANAKEQDRFLEISTRDTTG